MAAWPKASPPSPLPSLQKRRKDLLSLLLLFFLLLLAPAAASAGQDQDQGEAGSPINRFRCEALLKPLSVLNATPTSPGHGGPELRCGILTGDYRTSLAAFGFIAVKAILSFRCTTLTPL